MQSDRRRDSVLSLEVPVLFWQTLAGLQHAQCVQTDSDRGSDETGVPVKLQELSEIRTVCERNIIFTLLKVTDVVL